MSRPRALAVASGDKDVTFWTTAPVNVTHSNLVRRLDWDIPKHLVCGEHACSDRTAEFGGNESLTGYLHRGCHNIHVDDLPGWRKHARRDRPGRNAGSGCERRDAWCAFVLRRRVGGICHGF